MPESAPATTPPATPRSPLAISLRQRFWLFLLIQVIVVVGVGFGIAYFVYRTERTAWQGRQSEAALNAAQTVAGYVHQTEITLSLVNLMGVDKIKADPTILQTLLSRNPGMLEVVWLDEKGQVVA